MAREKSKTSAKSSAKSADKSAKSPGLLKQAASTAAGAAVGSAVGHSVGKAINSEKEGKKPCEVEWKQYMECMEKSRDPKPCQKLLDAFKTCSKNSAGK